jgi:pimeloyl-ACP methyl ester carboxylesterase
VDLRGLGESLPDEACEFDHPYGLDYMANGVEMMLGGSFLGCRVFDLLRVCDLLVQEGAQEIQLIGRGQGALLALFATVLHPAIISARLHDAPQSFESWTSVERLSWPAANCLRGVLQNFDLPDLYREFQSKVTVVSQWNAEMQPDF